MRAAVCVKDKSECEQLKKMLVRERDSLNYISSVETFCSGEELLKSNNEFDLVFLDVSDDQGIQTGISLHASMPDVGIVLISSDAKNAIKGYFTGAFRFLLKPVSGEVVHQTVLSFIKIKKSSCNVRFKQNRKDCIVSSDDIMYLESLGKKTVVRTREESYVTTKTLAEFEKEITDCHFFRTSRQFIVNVRFVSEINNGTLLINNAEIAVLSVRRKSVFLNYIKEYNS